MSISPWRFFEDINTFIPLYLYYSVDPNLSKPFHLNPRKSKFVAFE